VPARQSSTNGHDVGKGRPWFIFLYSLRDRKRQSRSILLIHPSACACVDHCVLQLPSDPVHIPNSITAAYDRRSLSMKKLLSKLPHIHRKSNSDSDQRPSSESKKPIKRAPLRTPVHRDANNDSNGPSKNVHSKDSTPSKRTSHLRELEQRASTVVTSHQPVGSPSQIKPDTGKSNIIKSGHGLPLAPQDTSLSDDLGHLTLGRGSKDAIDPSRTRYSEDVADRNVMANEKGPLPAENSTHGESISMRAPGQVDEFSEDIADRNMETDTSPNARSGTSEVGLNPMEDQGLRIGGLLPIHSLWTSVMNHTLQSVLNLAIGLNPPLLTTETKANPANRLAKSFDFCCVTTTESQIEPTSNRP
jgi:hypothetical protein